MTVYISQRLVCDLCGKEVRALEQKTTYNGLPQVIQKDYTLNHQGSLLDICGTCMPPLLKAFGALKLAKEAQGD